MKTRVDKRMVKIDSLFNSFFSKTALSSQKSKETNTFTFWCMVIPLGPHLVYT